MRRFWILLLLLCLTLGLAPAAAQAGVVQGHVYAYDGSPVAGADVYIAIVVEGEWDLVGLVATETTGFFSLSGVPATTEGVLLVASETEDGPDLYETGLTFVDPGTTTVDVRPGAITWTAARGGPWATEWRDAGMLIAGVTETGAFYLTSTYVEGVAADATVTGSAPALPADVRCITFHFASNEVFVWDAADPGNAPIPVVAGSTTALPFTIDQASARRIFFTDSYWRSGKPGTVLRLAMENFPAGTTLRFTGEGPNVFTRWGGKSYTSTGLEVQTVSLTVPTKTWPGYVMYIGASEPTRYDAVEVGLHETFQTCTLKASKAAISRGSTVKLSGVVPVQGHEGSHPGKPKYVWIYRRSTARSQPPTAWDATTQGWKLVARVRTDGLGRYSSALLRPRGTTWYVARYAGDEQYWRAYTSVLKVRVY